jgi:pimeloyl-ACP methyl ester carboxylesterase
VADALAAGIPRARLVVVEGAGHQVNLEARAEVADIVREHLRGFGAGSAR